jgi:hypothetical protein
MVDTQKALDTLSLIQEIAEDYQKMSRLVLRNLGIRVNYREAYKKFAFKKYGRRFGWRWLSNNEKLQAFSDALERIKD